MNDKFFELKPEKQSRMINAALKVFALSGYKHASTDDIVKEAGISKGLLFHYFNSKIGLYAFLFDFSTRFMLLEMSQTVRRGETGFFELIRQMEQARMQVMKLYPYMQQFINVCLEEDAPEAAEAIGDKRSDYMHRMDAYMAQADYSRLEQFGEAYRIQRMVRYTIAGITREQSLRYDFTPERLFAEVSSYIDMIQHMAEGKRPESRTRKDTIPGGLMI
ncbi:MAG: TetR/AcrR family transcriptional regulator [Lachnospiraceae bacterium]|nr:TetR/AcrR family transcriptional regulator [Lachnospiraceae bacterium]